MGAIVYTEKEQVAHARVKNILGRAVVQNEFLVIGVMCGVADENAQENEFFSVHIEPNLEIQVAKDDLATTTGFNEGSVLYFNQALGKFSDSAGADYVKVGQVARNYLGTKALITFFKFPTVQN